MWQRFTERARKAVFNSQDEAQKFGSRYISTEHLLLGLLCEGDSVAVRVLEKLGISLGRIRAEVEKQLPRGGARPSGDMTLTPQGKRVVDLAYDEALKLGNNHIGTEHLLLGLIREGDGLAGRVLNKLGADLEPARRITRSLQNPGATPDDPPIRELEAKGFVRRMWEMIWPPRGRVCPDIDMWQRFSERARKVVFHAQEEAQKFGEGYVSTEHLLLGLCRDEDSIACRALTALDISISEVRAEVEGHLPTGDAPPVQDMTLTPRAKRVIDIAYHEARNFNNNYIGTEHLLLGLIREGEGLAGRVLAKLGVELESAREQVMILQQADTTRQQQTEDPLSGGTRQRRATTVLNMPVQYDLHVLHPVDQLLLSILADGSGVLGQRLRKRSPHLNWFLPSFVGSMAKVSTRPPENLADLEEDGEDTEPEARPSLDKIMEDAFAIALANGHQRPQVDDLYAACCRASNDTVRAALVRLNIYWSCDSDASPEPAPEE